MVKFLVTIAAVIACSLGAPPARNSGSLDWRVVNGTNAVDGQFPYQVSFRKNGRRGCSGSIISNRWVLTAAHCLDGASASQLSINVGTIKLNDDVTNYSVERIIIHENYDLLLSSNDIALAKTSNDIILGNNVATISIGREYIAGGVDVVISGWGATSWPPGDAPTILQFIHSKTLSLKECREKFNSPYLAPIEDSNLCTLIRKGQGGCKGDSGGPLTANGFVVGIVSRGVACAMGFPDVFVRVSSFVDWIESNAN